MNLISSNVSDNTKIGVFLMALGSLFLWLGVMFLFDSVLLGLGNVLFLSGFVFVFGFMKAARVLMKKVAASFHCSIFGRHLVSVTGRLVDVFRPFYGSLWIFKLVWELFPLAAIYLKASSIRWRRIESQSNCTVPGQNGRIHYSSKEGSGRYP